VVVADPKFPDRIHVISIFVFSGLERH